MPASTDLYSIITLTFNFKMLVVLILTANSNVLSSHADGTAIQNCAAAYIHVTGVLSD
jgi:hypothetical protein